MIKIKLTHPDCMPKIGSEDAAGMDLRAFFGTNPAADLRAIAPGKSLMIDTGVAVEIPRGWFGLVVPRSSLGKRHLMIANTAGVIDSDYRGTIKIQGALHLFIEGLLSHPCAVGDGIQKHVLLIALHSLLLLPADPGSYCKWHR